MAARVLTRLVIVAVGTLPAALLLSRSSPTAEARQYVAFVALAVAAGILGAVVAPPLRRWFVLIAAVNLAAWLLWRISV